MRRHTKVRHQWFLKVLLAFTFPKFWHTRATLEAVFWFPTCSAVRSQGNAILSSRFAVQSCVAAMHLLKYLQVGLPLPSLRCLGLVKVVLLVVVSFSSSSSAEAKVNWLKRREDTERSLELEFDDECTMSDDGGVTTLALPRLRKVLHVSRCYEILGMKIPIAFPPGQIMSRSYKVRDIQTQLKTSGLATWLWLWTSMFHVFHFTGIICFQTAILLRMREVAYFNSWAEL